MPVLKRFAVACCILMVIAGPEAAAESGKTGLEVLPGRIDIRLSDHKQNVHAYAVDMSTGTVSEIPDRSDEPVSGTRAKSGEVLENPYGPHALRSRGIGYLDALIDTAGGVELVLPEANVRIKSYVEPFAWSPDGRYLASAVQRVPDSVPYDIAVIDLKTREIVLKRRFKPWIEDIVWSPDSLAVAVLGKDQRFGLLPWELLAALSGHPVPYHSFFLNVIDVTGDILFETQIRRDVIYGVGSIAWTG